MHYSSIENRRRAKNGNDVRYRNKMPRIGDQRILDGRSRVSKHCTPNPLAPVSYTSAMVPVKTVKLHEIITRHAFLPGKTEFSVSGHLPPDQIIR